MPANAQALRNFPLTIFFPSFLFVLCLISFICERIQTLEPHQINVIFKQMLVLQLE